MIMATKKNKPKFNVPNLGFFRSVKARWRKPRGTHNKKRMKQKWAGASPHIGYRNPLELRGMHPAGLREVLVHNLAELEGLKNVVVRIASGVGARTKKLMEEKARALSIRILNPEAKTASKHVPKSGPGPAAAKPAARPAAAAKPVAPAQAVKPAAQAEKPTVASGQAAQQAQKPARKAAPPKASEPPASPETKR
jgi:large subunit ribosomal protein L32e